MTKNATITSYNKYAKHYLESHPSEFYKRELEKLSNMVKEGKVIDIGCGPGTHASFFIQKGLKYTGIDASKKMVEIAERNTPQGTFKEMSFYNLEFPSKTFDGFWSSEVLLHVRKSKISQVLQNIRKIVKNRAVGFISIQKKDSKEIETRGILEEGVISQMLSGELIKRYIAFYTKQEFSRLLEDNDFKVVDIYSKEKKRWVRLLCYFIRAA